MYSPLLKLSDFARPGSKGTKYGATSSAAVLFLLSALRAIERVLDVGTQPFDPIAADHVADDHAAVMHDAGCDHIGGEVATGDFGDPGGVEHAGRRSWPLVEARLVQLVERAVAQIDQPALDVCAPLRVVRGGQRVDHTEEILGRPECVGGFCRDVLVRENHGESA